MIRAEGLTKRYGDVVALAGVSFSVERNEIVGFLGPNGAGKTTTLRILAGFLAPDDGRATIDGIDVTERPREAQARLGYLPEHAAAYPHMTVREYLSYRAELKGAPRRSVGDAIDRAGVGDVAWRLVGELSRGYRQRVGIADALLGDPKVLLLDEPTAGLDPQQIVQVRELVRGLAADRTVLLSSHILPEIEALAARVVILSRGRVVADVAPNAGEEVRVVVASGEAARAAELVEGTAEGDAIVRCGLAPDEAARRIVGAGIAILELGRERRRLEELFLEATR
jgi:ABC-2 type transport system ATP-binding protein